MAETQRRMPAPDDGLEPAQGHDVFISYSRADRDMVLTLVQGLAARGLRAWVDLESVLIGFAPHHQACQGQT